jgi:hypothetical protein
MKRLDIARWLDFVTFLTVIVSLGILGLICKQLGWPPWIAGPVPPRREVRPIREQSHQR